MAGIHDNSQKLLALGNPPGCRLGYIDSLFIDSRIGDFPAQVVLVLVVYVLLLLLPSSGLGASVQSLAFTVERIELYA